jgi:tRNA-2-methylthio-N6-dimethylallyladenosine synthase
MGSWIHLPLQSGSNYILTKMRRDYTKEEFIELCMKIRSLIPDIRLTTDIIVGFPTETEEQFQETLEVMEICNFDSAFMFAYSERPHTGASTNFTDDISPKIKQSRLEKVIGAQLERSRISNENYKGKKVSVMVEGISKRSASDLTGTMLNGKKVIAPIPEYTAMINILGTEINVEITSATSLSLIGKIIPDV